MSHSENGRTEFPPGIEELLAEAMDRAEDLTMYTKEDIGYGILKVREALSALEEALRETKHG